MPAFEPPFDDEVSPEVWASVHQLAFDWAGLSGADQRGAPGACGPPVAPATPGGARAGEAPAAPAGPALVSGQPVLPGPAGVSGAAQNDRTVRDGVAGDAVAGASAEARRAVNRFVSVCVEVLNGYRPAAHLRRLSMPGNAAGVVAQALAAALRVAELRRAAGRSPRRTNRHARRPDPVLVRRLRLCEPRPGAVEAAVLLVTADRTWALAVRLELHQQSWAATVLRLV